MSHKPATTEDRMKMISTRRHKLPPQISPISADFQLPIDTDFSRGDAETQGLPANNQQPTLATGRRATNFQPRRTQGDAEVPRRLPLPA